MNIGYSVKLKKCIDHTCPDDRENNSTAKIIAFLPISDGAVKLDRDLHGCKYWNIDDLISD